MRSDRSKIRGFDLLILIVLLSSTFSSALASPVGQEGPAQPPNASAGQVTYTDNCAPCHGQAGAGDGPAADGLSFQPTALGDYEQIAELSPADLFEITKNGRMDRMMPPWGARLTDQQIWNAVAYAWTLHTSQVEIADGKATYEANCAACHGPEGSPTAETQLGPIDFTDFNATSGTPQAAWARVLRDGRDQMPAFGDKLTDQEQRAVLEYVRSLSFGQASAPSLEPGDGVISGTIMNRTTRQPVAGIQVDLGIFNASAALEQRSTTADENGSYRFEELPTDPELLFIARTEYPAGFPYSSDVISFTVGQKAIELPLTVYEPSTDGSGVRAERVHYIIEFEADRLLVAELIVFSLEGDHTYIGDGTGVLYITLPPGAQGLEINDGRLGDRFVTTSDGFADTLPLPPGEGIRQLLYRYSLPIAGGSMELVRSLPYPAINVNVLVADVGEKIASSQLANEGTRSTPNGSYVNLVGHNIPANQPISIRLSNLPSADAPVAGGATQNRTLLLVLIGLAGLGAVALAAWPMLRHSRSPVATGLAQESRETLVETLGELDLAHEAGEIDDVAYQDRRLQLKARLLDLISREDAG